MDERAEGDLLRPLHSALAIRQMVVDASTPDLPPCPTLRLAAHLGAGRVDPRATDPTAQVQAVGETLALPVRLLGHAEPGAIVVSPEVGRLVADWVALGGPTVAIADRGPGSSRGVWRGGGES